MFNVVKSIKAYFSTKTDSDSCEFKFEGSLGDVLDKRYDRQERAYDRLSERYKNLDELPEKEYSRLMHKEMEKIRQEDELKDIRKKSLLRIVKTLRSKEEIEDAVNSGHNVLKQKVKPSKAIRVTDIHIKDKETGKIDIKPYNYHALPRDYDRYEVVEKRTYYPYDFPSKVAAYVLPDDLEVGERVIIEDLIEDIVGASHAWGNYRLASAEAVWNGEKFVVDCDSYDLEITMG